LIFDSHYNPFSGIEVILECKRANQKKAKIKFMATGNEYFADEIGTLKNQVPKQVISAGDVGYLLN
jgi:GTP-binding protein LepA